MADRQAFLRYLSLAATHLTVALTYYASGLLSLTLAGPSGYASAIWPPAGIALAVFLAYGYKFWPGIFLGALAVNMAPSFDTSQFDTFYSSLLIGFGIASGATVQALAGAYIVRRYVRIPSTMEHLKDIGLLILLGGPLSCLINATLGIAVLISSGSIPVSNFIFSWLTWWVGDSIGVMVFTPVLLLLLTPNLAVSRTRKIVVSTFLAVTFVVSILVFMSAIAAENRRHQANFDREASHISQQLEQNLHGYFYILLSIERLFASSDYVGENEFHTFVKELFVQYPGLNALTWRPRVTKGERSAFESEMRKTRPDFSITERNLDTGERSILGERDVYFPTTYVEYPDNRPKILGGDVYVYPIRREALNNSWIIGKSVMTDRVIIFDKNDNQAAASVIFHPIYKNGMPIETTEQRRDNLLGFIAGSFVFSEMLKGINDQAEKMELHIRLSDRSTSEGEQILYDSSPDSVLKGVASNLITTYESQVKIGGQNWLLEILPTASYVAKRHSWAIWMVLAAGLMFTSLFGVFLLLVTGRTDVIKRTVDEKTEELSVQGRVLEEINRLNTAVLSSANYLIIATDVEGKIIVFNREAEKSLGYTIDEVLYRETPGIWHDSADMLQRANELSRETNSNVPLGFDVFITIPLARGSERREWTFIRKDGSKFSGELTVTPLLDNNGKPVGFLHIVQDITERKKIEKMKSEFISTVSHELRTPLTSIRGSLGLIAAGTLGKLPEKAASMVGIAHKNSERLVHIINDILDIEKLESGKMKMNIQTVSVKNFLQQAVESNAAYGDKYNVKFVLEKVNPGLTVYADPDRLMQVMSNLLSNAAKFSPQGGHVNIRAHLANEKVHFEVQDHGTGIAEEFRDRIFEKFAQADSSSTRRFEGTGLGLSIAKQFVEVMKGSLGFETEMGKGTTFYFDLPLAEIQKQAKPEIHQNYILVCEHDREVLEFMKAVLNHEGFGVDIAHNIDEARQKIKERSYAAITLDLVMPDMNGADFLRELRANPATYDLPVIVISVRADETRKILSGDALGVVDWLTKPIDHLKLVKTLRNSIEHRYEKMPRILHVEDDEDLTRILAEALSGRAVLISAATLKESYRQLHSQRFDLLILDLAMPDGSGLELLNHIKENLAYSIPVLILSASETTEEVQRQVAKTLVKSRMSEDKIIETIMTLIQPQSEEKREAL